ncbi:MAG: hypothetical protein JXK07_11870 [Spirochaetes bacterium]|nr:hypothetical protein [Spirochaetota bacterium]
MAELWIEDRKTINGEIELSARFESQEIQHQLWYRVESSTDNELAPNADPFILGILMVAMNRGENLRIHSQVSPSLIRNLEDFQRAWASWKPDMYRFIDISADEEKEPDLPPRKGMIFCFSGGVDSCFTGYRHTKGITTRFPLPVQTAVFVHGFDIPLSREDYYENAYKNVQLQLKSLSIDLYRVRTNFKDISVFWPHAFGSGVASVLSLFQKRYAAGLIAQGVPYSSYDHLVEGSNPLTDPMLSSASFPIIPDGGGFRRSDKIKVISEWTEGMKYLRVCWEGEQKDKNCCKCEKCIRNILTFRALGLPLPPAFPTDVSDERIYRLGPLKEITISVGYSVILKEASIRGMENENWVRALKKAIHRSRMIRKLWSTPWGRFKLKLIRLFRKAWRQPVSIQKF